MAVNGHALRSGAHVFKRGFRRGRRLPPGKSDAAGTVGALSARRPRGEVPRLRLARCLRPFYGDDLVPCARIRSKAFPPVQRSFPTGAPLAVGAAFNMRTSCHRARSGLRRAPPAMAMLQTSCGLPSNRSRIASPQYSITSGATRPCRFTRSRCILVDVLAVTPVKACR